MVEALRVIEDDDLIAELKSRGYKVYKQDRIKIVDWNKSVTEQALSYARLDAIDYTKHDIAKCIGYTLAKEGLMVFHERKDDILGNTVFTGVVAVIVPKDEVTS